MNREEEELTRAQQGSISDDPHDLAEIKRREAASNLNAASIGPAQQDARDLKLAIQQLIQEESGQTPGQFYR